MSGFIFNSKNWKAGIFSWLGGIWVSTSNLDASTVMGGDHSNFSFSDVPTPIEVDNGSFNTHNPGFLDRFIEMSNPQGGVFGEFQSVSVSLNPIHPENALLRVKTGDSGQEDIFLSLTLAGGKSNSVGHAVNEEKGIELDLNESGLVSRGNFMLKIAHHQGTSIFRIIVH